MGFFDFLTRPGAPAPAAAGPGVRPSHDPGATRAVRALLAQPRAQRDPAWSEAFLAQVADAAFFTGEPEVVLGAGRPYFALHTEPADAAGALPHPSHVIHHLLEDLLLERGLGAVINPVGADADWAFTYGDLLQFHLHGGFYPARTSLADPMPAEARLPAPARQALRSYLQQLGVAAPGVRLGAIDHAGPGSLELVFRFAPQEFQSPDAFQAAMATLAWFLPRNYSYSVAGIPARQDGGFEPL